MPDTAHNISHNTVRRIIHVDMDAFFASVEQRDFPEFRGKPLIVGGQPDSRGVVAACSYEARQFGIRSAMACAKAYRLCNHAIFVRPRFDVYKSVSSTIREIFSQYTAKIEPLSLDEAYLDVTDIYEAYGSATAIAQVIRKQIKSELNLNASAGVSYNKFLAKTASDVNKPNGQFVIRPEEAQAFIAALPIGRFFGVGRVTEQKMKRLGIETGADLQGKTRDELEQHFGNSGEYYYQIARGIDEREVHNNRVRKSLGKERTFEADLTDLDVIIAKITVLCETVYTLMQSRQLMARTATLKVRYADFTVITRSLSLAESYADNENLTQALLSLVEKTDCGIRPVRLLGVSVSNFIDEKKTQEIPARKKPSTRQMALF